MSPLTGAAAYPSSRTSSSSKLPGTRFLSHLPGSQPSLPQITAVLSKEINSAAAAITPPRRPCWCATARHRCAIPEADLLLPSLFCLSSPKRICFCLCCSICHPEGICLCLCFSVCHPKLLYNSSHSRDRRAESLLHRFRIRHPRAVPALFVPEFAAGRFRLALANTSQTVN
jgi:hypothetical protein